ncbi:MAG: GNAT family N-acetyltransferase [Anaerolineae bacterium]|nr:GNAT family N-acetyltransferase [Anaerolineae bacterium]
MMQLRRNGRAWTDIENAQEIELRVRATIRLATEADLPKLEWYGQFAHFRRLYRQTFAQQVEGRRLMLVADVNGFPVGQIFVSLEGGFLNLYGSEPQGYLYALRVMEPFQRKGLGTTLVHAAEAELRTHRPPQRDHCGREGQPRRGTALRAPGLPRLRRGRWPLAVRRSRGRTRFVEEPCWLMEKML